MKKLRNKKSITTAVLMLLFTLCYGQVTFNKIPLDKQLVGRDLTTNIGNIIIEGVVSNSTVDYSSIEVELYRNDEIQNTTTKTLDYNSDSASFDFSIPILAELANYSIKIYSLSEGTRTLEKEVIDIVAGDVYIIQGQSNARANKYNGSANGNRNNFIRVFASGTPSATNLENSSQWFIGQGDGGTEGNGNTGQWGLKLANSIISETNTPIAIFNGAHGGERIDFFQAPEDYKTSLSSNYGRLYYRLQNTRLKNHVRAIFWSQGESNGNNTTITQYKNAFVNLKKSWLTDYTNIEQTYIFQSKKGCGVELMEVKEAQRQLAYENSDIQIMVTAGITHHTDGCHFPFKDGYEKFADRIFPLVMRDLYNESTLLEINPPMITNAYLSNETTLIVETDANELIIPTIAEDFELSNAGSATITNIEVSKSDIIFTLSEYPGTNPEISYLAQNTGTGNFIVNTNNLELVCFYKYPINTSILSINHLNLDKALLVYPNPTDKVFFIKLPVSENRVTVKIIDLLGKKIFDKKYYSNKFKIELPDVKSGIYLLRFEVNKKIIHKKIMIN
ncbi:Por secretion system C-terminal sorting domain-containing protein [Polaribacter sp. Hel1_33_78]|uniref:sialate O-acetylesterase n=1 Tax=Polaribacter sp. Hel1_33_78 TaxID=1336804 RepID=UPI00087CD4F0|nr:sialate O-acetylesterase [Polaribacter sp. Hel1_33_78]SDU20497.1 Por secretion system C-terminal sorting domain-containing protein [Polaribacter sp. Hel1_33_78]